MTLRRNVVNNKKFLLVGPTNVGKSTYFNRLTWSSSPVGNIERVTTVPITGTLKANHDYEIIDLPGINSLDFSTEDEQTSFKYLMDENYDGVINIVSVNTIKRDLLISLELAEAGTLNLININMADELKGYNVNILKLSSFFKVQVNLISAKRKLDINNSLIPILTNNLKYPPSLKIKYNQKIEKFINEFIDKIPKHKLDKRFLIIQALLGNNLVLSYLKQHHLETEFNNLKNQIGINENDIIDIHLTKQKIIDDLIKKSFSKSVEINEQQKLIKQTKREIILDKIFLNKYLSIPLFILIIGLIWFLTFYEYTGGWLQAKLADDGLGQLQELIKNAIINLNNTSTLQLWWANFVADGMFGGIFTILSFLPWIIILVFCITLLEQIGIMSRVCIAFDHFFNRFGLSGRSIVNMITGVGCNIPGILISRNANSKKERIISVMVAPFINCSARIIVIGYLSQILVSSQWTWAFNLLMIAISVFFCLFMAYFFSNLLFKKKDTIFITEIIKYHKPDFYIIFKKIINEVWEFLKRVLLIVFISNLIIWILTFSGPVATFYLDINNPQIMQYSFLRYLSIPFQIILYPLGLGNLWQLSISLITAFSAKEIAASNIETLFGSIDQFKIMIETTNYSISIVLSYLIFFSFYVPCLSTIVVIKKQIGWKYTWMNLLYGLLITWIASFIVFNIAGLCETFNHSISNNMNGSILCLLAIILILMILNHQFKIYCLTTNKFTIKKTIKINKTLFYVFITLIFILLIIANVFILK